MKYLLPEPMILGYLPPAERGEEMIVRGGPATTIPDEDKCPSGRHNKKLTQCWCQPGD